MDSTRKASLAAGSLFILATTAVLGAAALLPTLTGADYLTRVADHPGRVAGAALLYLVGAGGSVGIAVALYPVLRRFDAALALGSVVFRTIEAVFYAAAVVSLLSVLSLANDLGGAPAADGAGYRTAADSLLAAREHAAVVGVFAFIVGALMYYIVFYRARLVPRWLSGWGVVGAVSLMIAAVLALYNDSPVTGYVVLAAPIGLQEIALALWLLVKGFRTSPARPETPSSPTDDTPATTGARTPAAAHHS
jgi:hypothetical protein